MSAGRRGQALVELALVLPFLVALASVVIQLGYLMNAHLDFSAANAAVMRVAYKNDRTADQLRAAFDMTLGGDPKRRTFEVEASRADPDLDGTPSVRIRTSYRVPNIGILRVAPGPVVLRAELVTPLLVPGPGALLGEKE